MKLSLMRFCSSVNGGRIFGHLPAAGPVVGATPKAFGDGLQVSGGCDILNFWQAKPQNASRIDEGEKGSVREPGANGGEVVETVQGLVAGPGDTAQNEEAKERIIKRPGVMPRNGNEQAAWALFADPD